MKKILCIFGTRPEAIKMAPVILALQNSSNFISQVCVTAQHRSMLDQILNLFDIKPDYDLNIMAPNQTLTHITAQVLTQLEPIYTRFKPDYILVQGDTTTSFAAALSAYYHKIAIGHIEAGLRTHDKYSPWPEEINRKLISGIADRHFAPTANAEQNLLQEGVPRDKIVITGNSVIDALLIAVNKIKTTPALQQEFSAQFSFLNPEKKLILVTGHRRENFGEGFKNICIALRKIAVENQDKLEIVYPVHLNPNVQQPVRELLTGINNIHLIEPQNYLPFIYLLERCYLVLSDSGGIQEEAPALGKPVLVMRENTERPEGIAAGTAKLTGTRIESIIDETLNLINNPTSYQAMSLAHNPYGDGTATKKILAALDGAHHS